MHSLFSLRYSVAAAAALLSAAPVMAQARDYKGVARNLVTAAMVKPGDKVLITGSVRDAALMEDVAIEAMKKGGQTLISIGSDQLTRRSYDEVPATYDNQEPTLGIALINTFDVQIAVDVGETEGLLAHVPVARIAARSKAGEPANALFYKRGVRYVNLGNGLYPTATIARRLGVAQPAISKVFWTAAEVPATTLRDRATKLHTLFSGAKRVTITHQNGTNISFGVDAGRAIMSDGAITDEKVRQGGAAMSTWLPAGELILPAAAATAEGKVVFDRVIYAGKPIVGLTLNFHEGKLTSMTAASGIDRLKSAYDAAGGQKDLFGFIDIGVNDATKLPVGSGYTIWTAPGSVVIGFGDNRGFGGDFASDFGFAAQLGGTTIKADDAVVVDKGRLR